MPPQDPPDLTLYSSTISNASARLRIALNLKQLPYKLINVNLSKGEQHHSDFRALNPSGTVPLLVYQYEGFEHKTAIGQSIAALEYLDEAFPKTEQLLPKDPSLRAHIRTLTALLAADMHPLLTHRVSKKMREMYPEADVASRQDDWDKYWVIEGLRKFESILQSDKSSGKFCMGNDVTLADVVLLPEVWFAKRLGVDIGAFPRIDHICSQLCQIEGIQKEEQTLE